MSAIDCVVYDVTMITAALNGDIEIVKNCKERGATKL